MQSTDGFANVGMVVEVACPRVINDEEDLRLDTQLWVSAGLCKAGFKSGAWHRIAGCIDPVYLDRIARLEIAAATLARCALRRRQLLSSVALEAAMFCRAGEDREAWTFVLGINVEMDVTKVHFARGGGWHKAAQVGAGLGRNISRRLRPIPLARFGGVGCTNRDLGASDNGKSDSPYVHVNNSHRTSSVDPQVKIIPARSIIQIAAITDTSAAMPDLA